ncbi:MAG: hypothetical protein GF344_15940 [Chitinivibrionales bacterium]|nr:hypothetical protein [Chitinivibrionales bacterium]
MKKCSMDFDPQVCRFCDGFADCLIADTRRMNGNEEEMYEFGDLGETQHYVYDGHEEEQELHESH